MHPNRTKASREDRVATTRSRGPLARDERYGEITPEWVYGPPESRLPEQGRQEIVRDPSLVDDVLEESASMSQDEEFEIRARKRGRRRAAIENALPSFATNDEQHYQGGWQPSKPLVRRPESVLTIGTGKENEGHYTPPYRWTKRYLAFLKYQKNAPLSRVKERTLQELAQPLSETRPVFSEDRALELIEAAMLKELHENRPPRKVKYSRDWSLVAKSPELDKRIHYFAPGRWRSAPEEPATSAKKRKAEEALATEPPRTRKNSAVAYKPLGSPSDPLSRRLPAEELGFKEYEEDSREHIPEIGTGNLMPPEMKEFDFQRDGMVLENVPDREERHYPGAASFMFGETGYLSALMSREIAIGHQRLRYARNRNWNLEVGHEPEPIKDPPSPPPAIVLQSEKFALPPLERGQKYQGRFAPPPGCPDQNSFRPPTPPSPTKPLAVAPAPSFPSPSVSSPSRSTQNRPSPPKIPQPAHE
ncbi:hypothetical protein MMC29_004514, partial [Sticta canariensis]|nr:hypothetical protein [Sticta canariensis]